MVGRAKTALAAALLAKNSRRDCIVFLIVLIAKVISEPKGA